MKQEITKAAIKWGVPNGYKVDKYSEEKIVSIWIQEVVMKWWNSLDAGKQDDLNDRYASEKGWASIQLIYLKEQESKEVSNDKDEFIEALKKGIKVGYPELKEEPVSEMKNYICLHCKLVTDFEPEQCSECGCKSFTKTFATPTKEPVSVEEAAKNHCNCGCESCSQKKSFISGANWKKQQDKAIIVKLVREFNVILTNYITKVPKRDRKDWQQRYIDDAQLAITKAETYINN